MVAQMREDENKHMQTALGEGAADLPRPVQLAMRASGGLMTRVAHYL